MRLERIHIRYYPKVWEWEAYSNCLHTGGCKFTLNAQRAHRVTTVIQEISPEEEARGTSPFAAEIRNISINIRSLETDLCETTLSRQSAREHGRAKFAIREAMIT